MSAVDHRTEPSSPALRSAAGPSGIDGIPATYDDGREWLRSGMRRQSAGAVAALFFAWSGFWLALWGAAFGAVFGALIATGVVTGSTIGSGALSVNPGASFSAVAFVGGLFLGMVAGFVGVLQWLIIQHPVQWIVGVIFGFILAVAILVAAAAYERLTLRLRGYRRLSRDEVRRIAPLVKDIAETMDLDGLPRFAMTDSVMPGAWAHMRTVVLSTGLLASLDDGELRAILAHELHHWRRGDGVGRTLVWACAWPIALTLNVGLFITGRRPGNPQARSPAGFFASLIGWAIAWPAWVISRFILVPIIAKRQRAYEYSADAAAGQLGHAPQLIAALSKLSAFETGRTGWETTMAATHPPTVLRIEALQPPKPDDAVYQEDDLSAPRWLDAKRLLLVPFQFHNSRAVHRDREDHREREESSPPRQAPPPVPKVAPPPPDANPVDAHRVQDAVETPPTRVRDVPSTAPTSRRRGRRPIAFVLALLAVVGAAVAALVVFHPFSSTSAAPTPTPPAPQPSPTPPTPPEPANISAGRRLFISNTCFGCHMLTDSTSTATVGPDLSNLRAPAAREHHSLIFFIRQGIVSPVPVPGYPPRMPTIYPHLLSSAQIDDLVSYIAAYQSGK